MNTTKKTILVTGATGKQGGAVASHLLLGGWPVRALTRDPDTVRARELRIRGAEIVQGDLNDESSLGEALEGIYGVYSVQTFVDEGVQVEASQGIRLANMAREAGIGHFVYSSVANAHRNTGIPHFESKWRVEQHIRTLGIPATIVRPAFFMDNFTTVPGWKKGILEGGLGLALKPRVRLQMVAVDDIGAVVAMAFGSRERFLGQAVEIAGDEMTGPEIAEVLSRLLSKRVNYEELPVSEIREYSEDLAVMYEWFNNTGLNVDIAEARRIYPGLKNFETWARVHFASGVTV